MEMPNSSAHSQPNLYLKISNNELLESGKISNAIFDQQGGTIGSYASNTWVIQNQKQDIANIHVRIEWRENSYCIAALSPQVFVNNTDIFTAKHLVKLQQNDQLIISDLRLQIIISDNPESVEAMNHSLPSIVSSYDNPLQEILDKDETRFLHADNGIQKREDSILGQLPIDPFAALDSDSQRQQYNYQSEFTLSTEELLLSGSQKKEPIMDNSFLNMPQAHLIGEEDDPRSTHLTLTPLLRGLGAEIPLTNTKELHDFLEEIGASLRKTVQGLIALHQTYVQLTDKHLTPIEDNPIRLNKDYHETMNILYGKDKCPVHLSPTSAISESLEYLRLHNEANQIAISRALKALLVAFSPDNLAKRFTQYRRTSDVSQIDNAWLWKMYQSYYQELTSDRQNGFEKLFNEVYQQTYDYEIRRLQLES